MKIRNDYSSDQTSAPEALAHAADPGAGAGKAQTATAQTDQITLSPEARLMKSMTDAAGEPVAIRQDLVDRMRALLDSGRLGDDPERLADAIIDDGLAFP